MALLAHAASAAPATIARPQPTSRTPTAQLESPCSLGRQWGFCGGRVGAGAISRRRRARRDDDKLGRRSSSSVVAMAAVPDAHAFSFAFLAADLVNLTDFPVRIDLDPAREIITERSVWRPSEEAIKTFYMVFSLIFCWGCCVFGSMNDKFYDGEEYRKAGGNGTGHWIYDQQEREERAAREEIWSEDLIKEIEEKAEEVRRAEEKEKEKDLELV